MNNNTNNIYIDITKVYGKKTIYPLCKKGLLLAEYKGQKTFTSRDIELLKQLGYSFTVKQNDL